MNISSGYRKSGFDAYGGRILKQEDMACWMNREERTSPQGVAFGLGEEIEEVESDFFELLPTLTAVWIENPKCRIRMNDAVKKLFQDNNVLIRGRYDTSAEQLARELHLRFLLLDTELASVGDYFDRGNDCITLRFYGDGSPYIHQDCRCQGISAGNTGGGETSFNLPNDFYLSMKPGDIADKCWGSCRSELLSNGKLASLLKKMKAKKGYLLDFRKD